MFRYKILILNLLTRLSRVPQLSFVLFLFACAHKVELINVLSIFFSVYTLHIDAFLGFTFLFWQRLTIKKMRFAHFEFCALQMYIRLFFMLLLGWRNSS